MIRFLDATKRFGRTSAVDRFTLAVGAAEVVALLGPNGSGKTTTLKMAAGLIRPDAGTVRVGDPPREPWEPQARRVLSFLPQRVAFPETLTGREIVEFYRRLRGAPDDRRDAVLRFASLNGAGERAVGTYSGGMVQRLGLAVAMLPDAPALLLDEPTAALDPEGLAAFNALVEERRAAGRTILFTSHQVGEVERVADRIVVMVQGRVAREYTREALRAWRDANGTMTVRLAHGETVAVSGPAAERPAVLDSIRARGGVIAGFTAEDGRLETLYAELVAESMGSRGRE
jgi:Cu-processing system ATP-binding protein